MKPKHFLALASLVWIGVFTRAGFSQTPEERAGARAAADQGYDAFQRGEWAEALDLFGRAESLVHSPVHLLYLARSHTRLDRLIEAREAYLLIAREPLPAGASVAVKQAHRDAEQELALIEPQIPSVTVQVEGAGPSESIQVTQDGRELPPALIGVERPLNPGEHVWQARSGPRRSETITRRVQPGTKGTLTLHLPEAEIELVPRQKNPVVLPVAAPAEQPASGSGPSAWVYVGFGVAAAGLATGAGFLLQQGNIEDEIRSTCQPDCLATPENRKRLSDADRAGLISAVGFTAGGVGLAGALTLWLLAPDPDGARSDSARKNVQPWFGWGSAGVSGRF